MTTRARLSYDCSFFIMSSDDAENHYGVCPHADRYKNFIVRLVHISEFCVVL